MSTNTKARDEALSNLAAIAASEAGAADPRTPALLIETTRSILRQHVIAEHFKDVMHDEYERSVTLLNAIMGEIHKSGAERERLFKVERERFEAWLREAQTVSAESIEDAEHHYRAKVERIVGGKS